MPELLDQLKEGAGQVISEVDRLRKSGQIQAAISGLQERVAEADRKRKIKRAQTEIGKLRDQLAQMTTALGVQTLGLYDAGQLAHPELIALCEHIGEIKEEIAAKEKELADLQPASPEVSAPPSAAGEPAATCSACGGPLPAEGAFCPHCGAPRAAPPQFCVHCGAELRPQARFCPKCGQSLLHFLSISLVAILAWFTLNAARPATAANAQRAVPHVAQALRSGPQQATTDDGPSIRASASYTIYLPIVARRWPPAPAGWLGVDDFLYQLQALDLAAAGDTAFDLIVMDYSADGSDEMAYTPAQVAALRDSPGGPKRLLAYLSIGEAEDYRYYWDPAWETDPPAWLDAENPNWPGNYKVRYWDPDWQAIISGYLDRTVAAGFDGAYLDLIDAYEYYEAQGRTTARQEMVDFVLALAAYARATDPGFAIFPQNTGPLLTEFPEYLAAITGVGQESLYYGYDADDQPTPPAVTAVMEVYMDVARAAGKLVLTVDYATTPSHVDDVYARSQARGYVPYVTVRDLDRLIIHPGHEPD